MRFIFDTDYIKKPLWNLDEQSKSLDKMYAVALDRNLETIVDDMNKCIREDIEGGRPNIKEVPIYEIDGIVCDLDSAIDEYSFKDDENEWIQPFSIEVVTPEIAESNDKEWLNDVNYTDEDRASYVLGEVMSDYTKLPVLSPTGVQYYYKLM